MHLLMHAKTFGTLTNTQVGIKEMVHRIFKGMVPKMNCKNIDLDLLKRYNTIFAIRHLVDGGIDPRFNRPCTGFTNLGQLFLNWYVTEDKYSIEEQAQNDDAEGKIKLYIIYYIIYAYIIFTNFNLVTSPVNFISNIFLKKNAKRGSE